MSTECAGGVYFVAQARQKDFSFVKFDLFPKQQSQNLRDTTTWAIEVLTSAHLAVQLHREQQVSWPTFFESECQSCVVIEI